MATVQELLQERVGRLRELTDQIDEEISGDPDLGRLSELADQLGSESDEFASTVTQAQGILAGDEQTGEEPEADAGEDAEGGETDGGDGEEG